MALQKILFVIESFAGGGAEKVLSTIAKNFDHTKYDITVFSLVNTGVYKREIEAHVKYQYIVPGTKGKTLLFRIWISFLYHLVFKWLPLSLVYHIFIPKGFDVEVAFIEGFVTKLMAAGSKSSTRKIAWVHCDLKEYPWPLQTGIYNNLEEERTAYNCYDKIAVVSETSRNHFVSIYGLNERTLFVHNPIDKEDIQQKSKAEIYFPKNKFRFISVGRLVDAKGFDRLIEACVILKRDGFDFELIILGEGTKKQELEKQIELNHLDDTVKLLGFQNNPYPFLTNSDCFVCSSRTEGYSLVIAEAMCCGLPIISTDCAGPSEILKNGEFGILVENNTEGIVSGMRTILNSSGLETYKNISLQRSENFSLKKSLKIIYDILS